MNAPLKILVIEDDPADFQLLDRFLHQRGVKIECKCVGSSSKRFKYISPVCKQVTGYYPEEFLTDPELMVKIIHHEDLSEYKNYSTYLSGIESNALEFRIIRKEGALRWVKHSCQPMFGESSEYLGRSGTIQDITERKLAEVKLDLYSDALSQSLQPILLTDMDLQIIYINSAFTNLLGYQLCGTRLLKDKHGRESFITSARMAANISSLQSLPLSVRKTGI